MMNSRSGKRCIALLSLIVAFLLVSQVPFAKAQPQTHTVQRGDTLWDICETYYGDPNLWPRLWEMNPFVTNPHLLKPGDIITLFSKDQLAEVKPAKPREKPLAPAARMQGVDMTGVVQPQAMGYLSLVNVEAWGHIEATTSSRLGLYLGDTAFIRFDKNEDTIRKDQEFAIAVVSPLVRHPLTQRPLGYVVSTRGKLVIKERIRDAYFRAEVSKVYSEIGVGSLVMPATPELSCVQPMSTDPKLYGNIVALKENQQVLGQYSVVYLDSGFKDGVKRGSVFDLINIITVPSPNFRRDSAERIFNEITDKLVKEDYLLAFWNRLTEGVKLYEQSVGKIIVLESRPDTSTAVVLRSSHELSRGAFVKGVSWVEAPDYLALLPSCTEE